MVDLDAATALYASVRDQRANQPLSILNLAEPILSEQGQQQQPLSPSSRNANNNTHNDSSSTNGTVLTPATLSADLAHYRDLFSKLRFSYTEQVTKEKYLRSIVGDPPVLYSASDNLALEDRLAGMKAALKAKKTENDLLVTQLETLAARLAERYDFVTDRMAELEHLPAEIEAMQTQVRQVKAELKLREEENGNSDDEDEGTEERMNMTLEATQAAAEERRAQIADIERQIETLRSTKMPAKIRECEAAEKELEELEGRRNEATKLARDAKLSRENGGRDVVEDKGRWYRGEEAVLRGLLGMA